MRSNEYRPCATANSQRWFEVNASKLGAEHFDKKYGSGAPGYTERNENFFDKESFWNPAITIPYQNPRDKEYNKKFPISNPDIIFGDFIPFL